jgi:hypothetical protein
MKNKLILLITLLLVAIFSRAQVYQIYPAFGGTWKAIEVNETIHFPYGPTNTLNGRKTTRPGALFYNTTDSSFYQWTGWQFLKLAKSADALNISSVGSALRVYAPHLTGIKSLGITNGLTGDTATSGQIGIKLGGLLSANTELDAGAFDFRIMNSGRFLVRTTTNTRPLVLSASNGTDSATININRTSSTTFNASMTARSNGNVSSFSTTSTSSTAGVNSSAIGVSNREGKMRIDTSVIAFTMQQNNDNFSKLHIYYDSMTFDNGAGRYIIRNLPRTSDASTERIVRYDTVTKMLGYYPNTGAGGELDINVYEDDGTLDGDRRINADGYPITFDSTGLFRIRDTSTQAITGQFYGHIYDFNDGVDFYDYDSVLNVQYTQNSLSGFKWQVTDRNNLDTNKLFQFNEQGFKLQDGTQGNGKVLTSNAAGLATWQSPAAGGVTSIATTSPITGGTITTTGTIGINDAAADGSTKGAASFVANDFNATSGNVGIDYTNGQAASGSTKGFLTSADWTTFNGKGNVSKVGTPADNQVGVWTGDGTIEGPTGLTYTGSVLTVQPASNNTNTIQVNNAAGTGIVKIGSYPGAPTYGGMWFGNTTPSSSNYGFLSDGAATFFNGPLLYFRIGDVNAIHIDASRRVGIGTASQTSLLHLGPGSASANTGMLKFTPGTNLTTPEAGAVEWNGTNLFITQTTGPTRKTIAYTTDIPSVPTLASNFRTPTATNDANVDASTPQEERYYRIGDIVFVSGTIQIDATASNATTTFFLDFPIASAITDQTMASGQITAQTTTGTIGVGYIIASVANDNALMNLTPSGTGAITYSYSYSYRVVLP